MKRSIMTIAIGFVLLIGLSVSGEAADFIISPNLPTTLGGLQVHRGDMVEYYADTDTAKLIFDGSNFDSGWDVGWWGENIDAYADNLGVDDQGFSHLLISTTNKARLGDVTFKDGDLVEVAYDYINDNVVWAELFFSENLFSRNEDIDAVWYLPDNQEIVLSTTTNANLGGLNFRDGDLVKYNPATDLATLVFSEDMFSGNEDIDAVMYYPDRIILSTTTSANLGGLSFKDGDVVKYNPATDVATLVFSEDDFSGVFADLGIIDVTAVAPIPGAIWLLGSGIAGLTGLRIRKKRYTASSHA